METSICVGIILILLEIREFRNSKKHAEMLDIFKKVIDSNNHLEKEQQDTRDEIRELANNITLVSGKLESMHKEFELKIRTSEHFDVLEGI